MDLPVLDSLVSRYCSNSLPENNIVINQEDMIHSDWIVADMGASSDFVDSLMKQMEEFKVLRNDDYFEDEGSNEWIADYYELQSLWEMVDGINEEIEDEPNSFNNLGLSTSIEIYDSGALELSGLPEPADTDFEIRMAMYETAPDFETYFDNKSYWKSDEVIVATVSGYIGKDERKALSGTYGDIPLPEV